MSAPTASKHGWTWHPIVVATVVAVVSAILTLVVIPWTINPMNDRRLINDARLKECFDILKNSMEVDQRLNAMITSIEMFIKDPTATPITWRQDRMHIKADIAQQYIAFDKIAWWWISQLPLEAKLLRIEVDAKILAQVIMKYQENVKRSVDTLGRLRDASLGREVNPRDTLVIGIADQTRQELLVMQGERQNLIGKLVYLFAPREESIQRLLTNE
jgi:hypothetical protein